MFVEFEIICDGVGWMRGENTWIQTAGYAFRRAAGEILSDFEAESSKTRTLGAGVRIFNGAVRTEREFPLKILFLACIQGLVFYLFCGTEIKISPAALRIRFLFTPYQSIFESLFSHMLQTNSNFIRFLYSVRQYVPELFFLPLQGYPLSRIQIFLLQVFCVSAPLIYFFHRPVRLRSVHLPRHPHVPVGDVFPDPIPRYSFSSPPLDFSPESPSGFPPLCIR